MTQVLDEAPIIRNIDRSSRREESTSTVYTQRRVQSSSWPGQLGVARRSIPSPPKHEHFSTNTSIYHQPWWRPDVSCHRFNGAPLELSVPASVERVVLFDRSITKLLRKGCAVRDACPRSLSLSLFRSNPLWPLAIASSSTLLPWKNCIEPFRFLSLAISRRLIISPSHGTGWNEGISTSPEGSIAQPEIY